jgi:cytochrome P450
MTRQPPGSHFLEWIKQTPNDGVLLLRSFFHRNRLLLTKPKALADVLVAHPYDFEKPARIRNFLRNVLGDGLIIVEGDTHKFQRKHLMPSFSFRHLKDLYPMMWRKALVLTKQIEVEIQDHPALGQDVEMADGVGTTEINGWASKITLDIIGVAGLGAEFHALKNSDNQLVKDYEELLEPNSEKLAFFLMYSFVSAKLTKALPWKMNRIFETTTFSLRNICRQLVRDKREAMKTGSDDHFDILSLLIRSNDFADDELIDQLLTFLAAGWVAGFQESLYLSLAKKYLVTKRPAPRLRGSASCLQLIRISNRLFATKFATPSLQTQAQILPLTLQPLWRSSHG